MKKEAIILFGGAFDPIHNGHIEMALAARDQLRGRVVFIPSADRAHYFCDTKNRLDMLKLVCDANYDFSISTYELDSLDTPLMYYTVSHFLEDDKQLYLLIGADQVNNFHNWYYADEISKLVKIYYAPRKGVYLNFENIVKYKMEKIFLDSSSVASSTAVREGDFSQVPKYIKEYIKANKLYKNEKISSKKADPIIPNDDISSDWEDDSCIETSENPSVDYYDTAYKGE